MIVTRTKIGELSEIIKSEGKKIVFTNGCFDIIHSGHVTYLYAAASFGDILVVGLNSDDSVKRLKGPERPLNDQKDRSIVLSALEMVDYVCIFEEDTPLELISVLNPDVLVKGGDYSRETIVGADFVEKNGGEVRVVQLVDGKSTTKIIEKMKKL